MTGKTMNEHFQGSNGVRDSAFAESYDPEMSTPREDMSTEANTSLELLEQHQAKEQARLLQRFRELRQWQQQQQQQLMSQQQQQLMAWQNEQSKIQSLIATQRGPQRNGPKDLKPNAGSSRSPIMTPPSKPRPPTGNNQQKDSAGYSQSQGAGISMDSGLVVSMQDTLKSQSSLPKPVMYMDPEKLTNPNDEDRYTNSELFSNPGSREDQLDILKNNEASAAPDWMSDTSENFVPPKLPPPRPVRGVNDQLAGLEQLLNTAPAGLLQQVLNLLPGNVAKKAQPTNGNDAIEMSASPTLLGPGQKPRARRLHFQPQSPDDSPPHALSGGRTSLPQQLQPQQLQFRQQQQWQTHTHGPANMMNGPRTLYLGPTFQEPDQDPRFIPRALVLDDDDAVAEDGRCHVNGGVGNEDDEWEDVEDYNDEEANSDDVDDDEEDEDDDDNDQNITAKEVRGVTHDEKPIQGVGGRKTFEQLLEEKLQQEEAAQKRAESQDETGKQRKQPFLRKGEGISRFTSAPKKPVKKPTGTSSNRKTHPAPDQNKESTKAKSGPTEKPPHPTDGSGDGSNKKPSVGARLKDMSKTGGSSKPIERKVRTATKPPAKPQGTSSEGPVAKLQLIHSVANKKMEEQKSRQREGGSGKFQRAEMDHIDLIRNGVISGVDRSPSLDSRSNRSDDHDSTELDSLAEFELFEDVVDNMSFCSNSSLVKKLVNNDKKGQKEVISRLKNITEAKKADAESTSARTEIKIVQENFNIKADGNQIGEHDITPVNSRDNAVSNRTDSNSNNNNSNSNINNKDNIHVAKPDSDSSDVTLTDSSDEDQDDDPDKMNIDRIIRGGFLTENGTVASCPSTSSTVASNSNPPQSPSKIMTRKVAPMSSKFTTANDTLSMLKALSLQAGLLTSDNPPPASMSNDTMGQPFSFQTSFAGGMSSLPANLNNSNVSNFFGGVPVSAPSSSHHSIRPNSSLFPASPQFSSLNTLPSDFRPAPFSVATGAITQTSTAFAQNNGMDSNSVISNVPYFQQMSQPFNTLNAFTSLDSARSNSQERIYNKDHYGQKSSKNDDESDSDNDDEEDEEEDDDDDENETEVKKKVEGKSGDTALQHISPRERQEEQGKVSETKTTAAANINFDDEMAWDDDDEDDNATCLKTVTSTASTIGGPTAPDSTPPTSKLVSKLFPKLKPKPSTETEKANHSLQQATSQPVQTSEGVQSRILREKLMELDTEIEKFRSENANLEKLRREREEGLTKLKQEIDSFQREKEEELKRLEEFKAEEMKKLKRERKLFDSYQKKVRSMPDKKEREEIDTLKNQLQELQDEMKRKESRWNASTARLKNKVAEVELENGELKEEVRILEKKRLEWMAAQNSVKSSATAQINGKTGPAVSAKGKSEPVSGKQSQLVTSQPRSSTPTQDTEKPKSLGASGQKSSLPIASTASVRSAIPTITPASSSGNKAGKIQQGSMASQGSNGVAGAAVVQNGIMPATSKGVPVLKPPAPPTVHTRLSGESIQAENSSVPVMMENTLPTSTPASTMPGSLASSVAPSDKSAALAALERAVLDKGDPSAYVETLHLDGKVEKTYKTGAKEIHFPNGTIKEISSDGQTIVCRLANGDIRQIFPDHRVVYIFAEAEIMQTTFPDGLETFQFKNGQIERRYPDGTVEITFPSKDVKYLFPDGGQEVILTDGTVMQYNSKGERTVEYPSGDREVHTAEYQRREFPDGIVKTVYSDGRHETRFPNGRVRMRDKAGNVIMDQIVYR